MKMTNEKNMDFSQMKVVELLSSDDAAELIPEVISKVIFEEATANLVAANVCFPLKTTSQALVINKEQGVTAFVVPECGEIPQDQTDYDQVVITPYKIAIACGISNELIEDSAWDIIARNIKQATRAVSVKIDTDILAVIETAAAANTTANPGGTFGIDHFSDLMGTLEADNYACTDILMHPSTAAKARKLDVFLDKNKMAGTFSKNFVGSVYGANIWKSTQVTSATMYGIDKPNCCALVTRRPMTTVKFDDVKRDMVGFAITTRLAPGVINGSAVTKMTGC